MNNKNTKTISVLLAFVMVLSSLIIGMPSISMAEGRNLLINGDFEQWEDGSPVGWFGSKSNITRSNVSKVEGDAQSGDASIRFTVTGTTHQRFNTQAISMKADTKYTLTYWVKGSGEIRNALFRGTAYTSYSDYTILNSDEWQKIEYTFSHTSDVNDLEIIFSMRNTKAPTHIQMDNVVLVSDIIEGPDTQAPVISHIAVTEANISQDLIINTTVTDDRKVESVNLFYRIKGQSQYKSIIMTLLNQQYSTLIPKAELDLLGLEYYIEASDGTNISTLPADINTPYSVKIIDLDILSPIISGMQPLDGGVLETTDTKPTVSALYVDPAGIDTTSVKLLVDGIDVTTKASITGEAVTYIPSEIMTQGKHNVIVKVKDTLGNEATKAWSFTIGKPEYQFYFGQLHSHTNLSDGTGTPDDAYTWARDKGKADFFAVTDHSNWFDNDIGSENITEVSQSTSTKWKTLNAKADQYNKDNEYVAIAGYEMTWSGSTGGWGHMNTFNTPWFASRSNKAMDLKTYYAKIAQWPDSINQLNHPGKTFGDFGDFGFYTEAADKVVQLIEVGNGEGPIRGSGYFPSYEYYTRALDKGWHIAPSNNQDNHKGNWVTSNDARNVVVAEKLTREGIYDGIRNLNTYATENKNLEIMYKINGEIMGSQLKSPEKLNFSIIINDPDINDPTQKISKIDIISNGGVVSATKTFDGHNVDWNFELDPNYSYYYVKVTQTNRDISVTAPIWSSETTPVGVGLLETSSDYFELGSSIDINASVYNNGTTILANNKVEFYLGSISAENKIGEETVLNVGQGSTAKATIQWTPEKVGVFNLYAVATLDGMDKQFTTSTSVEVIAKDSAIKVMIDYSHKNHYVSGGDYADKIESLKSMIKGKKMIMIENHNPLTDESLKGINILIVTSPQPIDRGTVSKSKLSDDEIQVVKNFTDRGGSLIITSRANYSDGVGEYQNSIQGNKVLNAIGSNIIFNSDQVVDNTTNGGQIYRLYFNKHTSQKYNLTSGFAAEDLYSFYSGSSVLLKYGGNAENVDFLVKGHSTTTNSNAGNVPTGHIPAEMGNVSVLAAEKLPGGGKIVASGTTFFSDFEMSGDNRYTNVQIASNILDWMKPETNLELKDIKEVRDGMPTSFGKTFTIEGTVTAMSEAYSKEHNLNNAFFEVIYVQDETGGMTVFGVSNTKLPLGTKVRVTGVAGEYEGDYQLQIKNESTDLVVIASEVLEVSSKLVSTKDSMIKRNEGLLVKIKGIVTRIDMTDNSLYLDDGSGESRVYVNGYIGDGSGDGTKLGKWDPSIKVGDTVSAVGLASKDPVGPRLRVRNTAEIIKEKVLGKYPLVIGEVQKNENVDKITVKVNIENLIETEINGVIIIKLLDNAGRAYKVQYLNKSMVKGQNTAEFNLNSIGYSNGIKTISVYIWDSLDNMKPLSEVK